MATELAQHSVWLTCALFPPFSQHLGRRIRAADLGQQIRCRGTLPRRRLWWLLARRCVYAPSHCARGADPKLTLFLHPPIPSSAGGLSYHSSLFGLACDNIVSHRVVLADGSVVDTSVSAKGTLPHSGRPSHLSDWTYADAAVLVHSTSVRSETALMPTCSRRSRGAPRASASSHSSRSFSTMSLLSSAA